MVIVRLHAELVAFDLESGLFLPGGLCLLLDIFDGVTLVHHLLFVLQGLLFLLQSLLCSLSLELLDLQLALFQLQCQLLLLAGQLVVAGLQSVGQFLQTPDLVFVGVRGETIQVEQHLVVESFGVGLTLSAFFEFYLEMLDLLVVLYHHFDPFVLVLLQLRLTERTVLPWLECLWSLRRSALLAGPAVVPRGQRCPYIFK